MIGYVNRRVASDRVEVTVHDARFLDAESQFRPDKGLVYVRDNGQTRLGEFIQAVLRDSENQIATHDYDKAADNFAASTRKSGPCRLSGLVLGSLSSTSIFLLARPIILSVSRL